MLKCCKWKGRKYQWELSLLLHSPSKPGPDPPVAAAVTVTSRCVSPRATPRPQVTSSSSSGRPGRGSSHGSRSWVSEPIPGVGPTPTRAAAPRGQDRALGRAGVVGQSLSCAVTVPVVEHPARPVPWFSCPSSSRPRDGSSSRSSSGRDPRESPPASVRRARLAPSRPPGCPRAGDSAAVR